MAKLQEELTQLRMACGRDQEYGGAVVPGEVEGWEFDAFLSAGEGFGIGYSGTSDGSARQRGHW